jgi:hypothetical protein
MIVGGVVAVTMVFGSNQSSRGQQPLSDPIYRVANDAPTVQPGAAISPGAAPAPAADAEKPGFDLAQQANEHPLAPVLRVIKASQEVMDRNVRDYSCTFVKQERIDGELVEKQFILLKVMEKPFSVYMNFLKPYAGREVCYVAGQNEGKAVVLEAGFKRNLGKLNLDPNGSLMMKGQKRPVTDVGIRNLTIKLSKMWEAESKFMECEVTSKPDVKINDRSTTMIQVKHPIPRKDFRFHIARLFLDNELKVPIHFDAYLWPAQEGNGNGDGDAPPLEESYTYQNLKLNNGFTAREFDTNNNPEIFQK